MGYIYQIENLLNHKIYIGQTTKERATDRFSQHRYLARHPEQETSISYLHRAMNNASNYAITENGALTHKSTMSGVLDMFALGGEYRIRSDADCILLCQKAYEEDALRALECLFYLRNVRGGKLFA